MKKNQSHSPVHTLYCTYALADTFIPACTAVKSSGGPGGSESKTEHLPDIVPETGETVSLGDWHVGEDAMCAIR